MNTVPNGEGAPASNVLPDIRQLISASLKELDSELRDINHKVGYQYSPKSVSFNRFHRFTIIQNWAMKSFKYVTLFL